MNPTTLHAMREELIKIAYMTAAGPMYTGNMPKSMGTGMVSARQAQQMTQMPGVRSMRRGGIVPAGKNQVAVLHGPEAVVPLKGGKPTKRGQQVLDKITEKKAAVATKTDPAKWEQAKRDAKAKMGGKHSARAMQLATQLYKKRGGGYSGAKPTSKNNSLKKWGKQKWQWSKGEKKKTAEDLQDGLEKKAISGFVKSRAADRSRAAAQKLLEEAGKKPLILGKGLVHPEYRAFERSVYQGTPADPRKIDALVNQIKALGGNRTSVVLPGGQGGLMLPAIPLGKNIDKEEAFLRPVITASRSGSPELATFLTQGMANQHRKFFPITERQIRTSVPGETPKSILKQIKRLLRDADVKLDPKNPGVRGERFLRYFGPAMIEGERIAKGGRVKEYLPAFARARLD